MPGVVSSRRLAQPVICSDSWITNGRGPTRLISPRSTFHSCGSSSMLHLRRNAPTRVMRGSSCDLEQRPAALHLVEVGHLEALGLGVDDHRAELDDPELAPAAPVARLAEEDRAARVELDGDRGRDQDRRDHQQAERRRRRCRSVRLSIRHRARELHRRQATRRARPRCPRSRRWTRTARRSSARSTGARRAGAPRAPARASSRAAPRRRPARSSRCGGGRRARSARRCVPRTSLPGSSSTKPTSSSPYSGWVAILRSSRRPVAPAPTISVRRGPA